MAYVGVLVVFLPANKIIKSYHLKKLTSINPVSLYFIDKDNLGGANETRFERGEW